jgi:CRP-like cAMP-binding protein
MSNNFFKKILKKTSKKLDDFTFLNKVEILKNLSKSELSLFAKLFLIRKFEQGEIIFRETYPHVVLYIIKSGEVEIFLENTENNIVISQLSEASHFGEIGLFAEVNRIASAKATKETTLYAVTKNDFRRFVRKNPATGIKLLYNLGEHMALGLINSNQRLKKYEIR